MLKILVDENISFADSAFNQFGKVVLKSGREVTNKHLKDIDVLIVRSITTVDEDLLKNTPVKFVGTATIGTDHIDLEYLNKRKIYFADAKGCNAYSVAEYVVAAMLNLAVRFDFKLKDKSIGIVGIGNVGSKVAAFTEALGMKVLLNDPPLKRSGDKRNFVDLDEILNCDIITLHTPLNHTGIDKTLHLINKENLSKINNGAIIINSSRGAVINNNDLLYEIERKNLKTVLDVWENEPDINEQLLKNVVIGTPHIAGYSYEGKVNGTKMIYNSLCRYLHKEPVFNFNLSKPDTFRLNFINDNYFEKNLNNLVEQIYSLRKDDDKMKKSVMMLREERIKYFDLQRKNYPVRREFNNYSLPSEDLSDELKSMLSVLRFNISN